MPELIEFPQNGVSYSEAAFIALENSPWLEEPVTTAIEGLLEDLLVLKLGQEIVSHTSESLEALKYFLDGGLFIVCENDSVTVCVIRVSGSWVVASVKGKSAALN
ncbi:MAG: hypothetical protein J7521_20790 [Caulobacter sp.]|nr:hypothetical protein [Caulobacter sp.]